MRPLTVMLAIAFAVVSYAKPHYFHPAEIISVESNHDSQAIVVDSPLGIFTVTAKNSFRRTPHFSRGPARVSIEPQAQAGDNLYLLDEKDREYRAVISERKSHPAPQPSF